jgi:hypothetical protein
MVDILEKAMAEGLVVKVAIRPKGGEEVSHLYLMGNEHYNWRFK